MSRSDVEIFYASIASSSDKTVVHFIEHGKILHSVQFTIQPTGFLITLSKSLPLEVPRTAKHLTTARRARKAVQKYIVPTYPVWTWSEILPTSKTYWNTKTPSVAVHRRHGSPWQWPFPSRDAPPPSIGCFANFFTRKHQKTGPTETTSGRCSTLLVENLHQFASPPGAPSPSNTCPAVVTHHMDAGCLHRLVFVCYRRLHFPLTWTLAEAAAAEATQLTLLSSALPFLFINDRHELLEDDAGLLQPICSSVGQSSSSVYLFWSSFLRFRDLLRFWLHSGLCTLIYQI